MSEEPKTSLGDTEFQYHCTQKDHNSIQRKSFLRGAGVGGGIVAIIALLLKTCNGDYTSISNKNADAGAAYSNDAGVPKCSDIKGCYDERNVSELQEKLSRCNNFLKGDEGCLYLGLLETCLKEKDEHSKRRCPTITYTPKACPPVEECPKIPYIRKGD
jgi:hypothetical protein